MDLRKQLIDGDPVAREPELDAFHAQTMRRRVVLEARAERERSSGAFTRAWWLQPIAVAAAIAVCLVAAVAVGIRINQPEPGVARSSRDRQDRPQTRQLQFATPGGTRIIWTFHQEFEL